MKFKKEGTYSSIIHVLLLILFAAVFVVGLCVTAVNKKVSDEHLTMEINNPLFIVLGLLGAVLFFGLLGLFYDKLIKRVNSHLLLCIFAVLIYALSVLWVFAAKVIPQSDAELVYNVARDIELHTQTPFLEDSYITFYPYQLGFVSFLRILIKIFGVDNFTAYECVLALFPILALLSGYGIIFRTFFDNAKKAAFFFEMLMFLCVPLYVYVPFMYGDIPFMAVSLFVIYMTLECYDRPKVWKIILLFLGAGVNYLFKSNALITLTAAAIFLIVKLITDKKKVLSAILILILFVGTFLLSAINVSRYRMYLSKDLDSVPMIAPIVMGMNDDNGNAGWCNFYDQLNFVASDYDAEASKELAYSDLKVILKDWAHNPKKAVGFFFRKINLQWNAPMYQCLCMTSVRDVENESPFALKIYTDTGYQNFLDKFMKLYQLMVYGSISFMLVINVKSSKKRDFGEYLLLLTVFGCFLFSLIWEAKTRYVFPAFIMCLPVAAASVSEMTEKVFVLFSKKKGK